MVKRPEKALSKVEFTNGHEAYEIMLNFINN